MLEKYQLLNEPDKTMFVFEKFGKVYGHIIKNPTSKDPAKFIQFSNHCVNSTIKDLWSILLQRSLMVEWIESSNDLPQVQFLGSCGHTSFQVKQHPFLFMITVHGCSSWGR
ncbi:MAG: hypothetical protein K0R67_635 [Paenibacillus sp.]|nr:hypothetical protein [Paenibacillus sp.]